MSEFWECPTELLVPYTEVNRHHIFWERGDYKTPVEKRLRAQRGAILKLHIPAHLELHHEIDKPPKVSPVLMSEIIRNNTHVPDEVPYSSYVQFNNICRFIENLIFTSSNNRIVEEASELANNLRQQQYFIEIGKVALVSSVEL